MNRLGLVAALVGAQALSAAPAAGATAATPRLDQQMASAPVLAIARCYGRFIAWRDELSSAMLETGAPPSLDAPVRFNRVETAFSALALRDRQLTLRLQPTFKETDFPVDIREAFRTGLKEAGQRFAARAYRTERTDILASAGQTPNSRMSAAEYQSDAAFADLGGPCDRFAKSLNWVKALAKSGPKLEAQARNKPALKATTKAESRSKADPKPIARASSTRKTDAGAKSAPKAKAHGKAKSDKKTKAAPEAGSKPHAAAKPVHKTAPGGSSKPGKGKPEPKAKDKHPSRQADGVKPRHPDSKS